MARSTLSLTQSPPTGVLNPVGPCLILKFQASGLAEQQGANAVLDIDSDCMIGMGEDSTMTINGVKITFTNGTNDPDCNVININASTQFTLFNALQAALNNIELKGKYNVAFTATGVTVTSTSCLIDLSVTFSGYTNGNPDKTLSQSADKVKLLENFEVALNIDGCGLDDLRVCIKPDHTIASDCFYVFSRFEKDISCLFENLSFESAPFCGTATNVFQLVQQKSLCRPTIDYSIKYGDTPNYFKCEPVPQFFIFPGTSKPDGWPAWEDYTGINGAPVELFSLYENGQTVCKDQCLFSYYSIPINKSWDLQIEISLFDRSGNLIFDSGPMPTLFGFSGPALLCVANGLCQWLGELQNVGYTGDLSEVGSFSFSAFDAISIGTPAVSTINYKVECCECMEQFLFMSETTGLWQTVAAGCINNATYEVVKETMKKCLPCLPFGSNQVQVINSNNKSKFSVTIPGERLNERLLSEFVNAKRIFWNFEGQGYEIFPATGVFDYYNGECLQDLVFDFYIFECEA